MSTAGDKLRLERERFERELRLSETTRDAAVGADDSAAFLGRQPANGRRRGVGPLPAMRRQSGASAGKSRPVMPTTPYREAVRAARAVDAAPAAPPSPKLESPTSDILRNPSARRSMPPRPVSAECHRHGPDGASRGVTRYAWCVIATRRDRDAARRRGAPRGGDEDPEAQAYLKGVLRMIYGDGDDEDDEDDDEDAPARALRAAVAARATGSARTCWAMTPRARLWWRDARTRARTRRQRRRRRASPSGSRAGAGSAATPPDGDTASIPVADPEPFAFRADAASDTAVDFNTRCSARPRAGDGDADDGEGVAPRPPTTTVETDAPAARRSPASPGGLPPTPTAVKEARAASAPRRKRRRCSTSSASSSAGSPSTSPSASRGSSPRRTHAEAPAKRPAARAGSPYRPATWQPSPPSPAARARAARLTPCRDDDASTNPHERAAASDGRRAGGPSACARRVWVGWRKSRRSRCRPRQIRARLVERPFRASAPWTRRWTRSRRRRRRSRRAAPATPAEGTARRRSARAASESGGGARGRPPGARLGGAPRAGSAQSWPPGRRRTRRFVPGGAACGLRPPASRTCASWRSARSRRSPPCEWSSEAESSGAAGEDRAPPRLPHRRHRLPVPPWPRARASLATMNARRSSPSTRSPSRTRRSSHATGSRVRR